MAEKLSVQIALEGADEIARQLADIGNAGTKAFGDIGKAAEQVGGFSQLKPEQVTASLKKMGVEGAEAIKKIQAAVNVAGRLEGVVAGVKALEIGFGRLRNVGANALNTLSSAAEKVGASLTRSLGPLAAAGRALGPIGIGAAGVTAGSVALVKFAAAAEETQKALTQLRAVSGQSFNNLSALSNVFAQGGTSLKQFANELGNLAEKIASAGEAAAKQGALSRQAEDIAKGLKVTELGAITLDERVKVLLETLSAVPPTEQWFRLADIFKGLGSDLERARIGKALGLSPESIATLSRGSAELQRMAQQAQQLGIALNAVDQKNLGALIQSQNTASALFDAIKEKMGGLVAPAIASFWEGFAARLRELIPVFTQIATSIGQMDFSSVGAAAANFLAIVAKIAAGWAAMISGQVSLKDVLGQMLQEGGQIAVEIGVAIGKGIIQGIISSIKAGTGSVWDAIKQGLGFGGGKGGGAGTPAPAMAGGGLLGGRGTGTSDSNLAWLSRGEYIMPARAVRQPGVLALLEALRRSGGIPGFQEGGLSSGPNFPQGGWPFSGFGDEVKQLVRLGTENNRGIKELDQKVSKGNADCAKHAKEVEDGIDIFWDALLRSSQGKNQTGLSSGRNVPPWPFAAGGLLGGRGTGTSDSNLAWLSRGEHIMPARAVSQPGVLAFLEALRRSGGNLSRVLDGMGRFALGGMVPRAIPAFATGGLAGGSNVTIQFPGLPAIGGLRASSSAVDELRKAAALAQVRSGGRKPSRYS